MNVKTVEIKDMSMLPPPKCACPVCAAYHEKLEPHNKDSLYYQFSFKKERGRWPTWKDAMEHCPEETKQIITETLKTHGVGLEEKNENDI